MCINLTIGNGHRNIAKAPREARDACKQVQTGQHFYFMLFGVCLTLFVENKKKS